MKYYRDLSGNYLGGWDNNPPSGAIEVPYAPSHARAVWSEESWGEPIINVTEITKLAFVRWAKTNNHYISLIALLNSDADLMFEWNAASELSINDPLVLGAAASLGLDAQAVFNEIGQ